MDTVYFSKHADNPLLLAQSAKLLKRFRLPLSLAVNGEPKHFVSEFVKYMGEPFATELGELVAESSSSFSDSAMHLLALAGLTKTALDLRQRAL